MELEELLVKHKEVVELRKQYQLKVSEEIKQANAYLSSFVTPECKFSLFFRDKLVVTVNKVEIVKDQDDYYVVYFYTNRGRNSMACFKPISEDAKVLKNKAMDLYDVLISM